MHRVDGVCFDASSCTVCHDTDLRDVITDKSLVALASAGCGAQLTSLTLHSEWGDIGNDTVLEFGNLIPDLVLVAVCLYLGVCLVSIFSVAGLPKRITDAGLRALAAAGCGERMTSLTLCRE